MEAFAEQDGSGVHGGLVGVVLFLVVLSSLVPLLGGNWGHWLCGL